jgi:2-iminobutanoate/2-iminopropanoate deaminase
MKEIINTENAPQAIGPYSQATKVGKLLFVSGQLPIDPETKGFAGDTIESQTRQSLTNLKAIIESTGMEMKNVVKTTVFLSDMELFQGMNRVYAEFFSNAPPARAAVEVAKLPLGALVEVEAIVSAE